jgi:hypothetical protein
MFLNRKSNLINDFSLVFANWEKMMPVQPNCKGSAELAICEDSWRATFYDG